MPLHNYPSFTPKAVKPIECLQAGWDLINDQYLLFVGMSLVALLIGQLAPMGILAAPMMCGVYVVLFEKIRGRQVEFGTLFQGFDFFGQGVIAMLIHLVPVFLVIMPFCVIFVVGSLLLVLQNGREPPVGIFVALALLCGFVLLILLIGISVLFTFAYPLIVDRKMQGVEAVKLSAQAALANFWGLLGLLLLNALLGFLGVLCCYVGALLFLPVGFAATACAYREVFGLATAESFYPPPPPTDFR
ncbi:MAG TPA: hypothetical protein VN643_24270 [Pyrinomonadaceae bacterium]|nr:hypothetical protein [Pyrinomonadaceae bacterium]